MFRGAVTLGSYDFHDCWRAVLHRPVWILGHLVYMSDGLMASLMANGTQAAPLARPIYSIYIWVLVWADSDLASQELATDGPFFQAGAKGGTTSSGSRLCSRHALSF